MNRRDAEGDSKNEVGQEHGEGANLFGLPPFFSSIPGKFSSFVLVSLIQPHTVVTPTIKRQGTIKVSPPRRKPNFYYRKP